jgi:hypothetical protein
MIYLIDPMEPTIEACPTKCFIKCTGVCGIKPLYGVPTDTE